MFRRLPRIPAVVTALAAALLLAPSLLLGTLPSSSSPQNLIWAEQFSEQFRAGILYPRWMPKSFDGLGGPAFYFYPPLGFWIDALLSVITGNVLSVSYRLSIASALLLWGSGLAMYAWLCSIADRRIALIGALAYMAAPYHLFDHYIRGAYAEFTAYAVLPLVILGIRRVADNKRGGLPLLAIAYAALSLSHLPTALLISLTAVPFYTLFCAWRLGDRAAAVGFLARCAGAGALGLGLAAIYLVPALLLQDAISAEQLWMPGYRVDDWFPVIAPHGLIRPAYVMLVVDTISAACCLVAIGVLVGLIGRKAGAGQGQETAFWAILCLASLLLLSGLVPWFWDVVPLVSKVQFPWRLLIVVEFASVTALCLMPWTAIRRSTRLIFAAASIAVVPGVGAVIVGIADRIDLASNGESLAAAGRQGILAGGLSAAAQRRPERSRPGAARRHAADHLHAAAAPLPSRPRPFRGLAPRGRERRADHGRRAPLLLSCLAPRSVVADRADRAFPTGLLHGRARSPHLSPGTSGATGGEDRLGGFGPVAPAPGLGGGQPAFGGGDDGSGQIRPFRFATDSASRQRISHIMVTPTSAVLPLMSNGGETSTTSPPTRSSPRRPRSMRCASCGV